MKIKEVTNYLEEWAPLYLQESYDNAGYIVGNGETECNGILVCLDCTEQVVQEAIDKKCNFIVAHHPIVFSGLKKLTGADYVQRVVIKAIQNNIVIYAIHTNLDNCLNGVNGEIASRLGIQDLHILQPKRSVLLHLGIFVPSSHSQAVQEALFAAGAGAVGNYDECIFEIEGKGSFRPLEGSNPTSGEFGVRSTADESYLQVILPEWKKHSVHQALLATHPYEEVAHQYTRIENEIKQYGSGVIGKLPEPMAVADFLELVRNKFQTGTIKFTGKLDKRVVNVAICGGSGQFLTKRAMQKGADIFLTSDIKYHEFFDAEEKMTLADMGHFESEQFTIELLIRKITGKFHTFAVHKTDVVTNPVSYF
jgi:dinuclear metal center YbgI/SA1388 family protein